MQIVEATRKFEAWLRRQVRLVERDLVYKHAQMRADPFQFFRATYYRWAQLWPAQFPKLAKAREVHAVGDLHVENFGTWRDAEGRIVWGVNDFDEAHPMAFTNDLVRLAVSALLAAETTPQFRLTAAEIVTQIADGYRQQIEHGGEPFVLMEHHLELRRMAVQDLRDPAPFWKRLGEKSVPLRGGPPDAMAKTVRRMLPGGVEPDYRVLVKPKGLGSLGHRRFIALAQWEGSAIAREAKEVAPSAWLWATGCGNKAGEGNPWLERTVRAAVRCRDPFWTVRRGWLVRRLGPYCSRIDIDEIVAHQDLAELLHAMGRETANIHLGTPKARKRLLAAWGKLPADWLAGAARQMHKASLKDWREFRRAGKRKLAE